MISSGLGIVAMTAIMPPPFNSQYYAGLIMCVIYCGSLIRLKFHHFGSDLVVPDLVIPDRRVLHQSDPVPDLSSATTFFLAMATGVGLFSAYIQELYIRKAYVGQRIVEEKNELGVAGARRSGARQQVQERIPGHDEPRAAHAAERHHRLLGHHQAQLFGPIEQRHVTPITPRTSTTAARTCLRSSTTSSTSPRPSPASCSSNEHEFDLTETLEACVRMCRGRADTGRVELIFFGGQSEIRAIADERLILQVVANLVTNAIKFTPRRRHGQDVRHRQTAERHHHHSDRYRHRHRAGEYRARASAVRAGRDLLCPQPRRLWPWTCPTRKRSPNCMAAISNIESELGKGTTVTVTLPPSRLVGHPQARDRRRRFSSLRLAHEQQAHAAGRSRFRPRRGGIQTVRPGHHVGVSRYCSDQSAMNSIGQRLLSGVSFMLPMIEQTARHQQVVEPRVPAPWRGGPPDSRAGPPNRSRSCGGKRRGPPFRAGCR